MPKSCQAEGCNNLIFSHGYCTKHQYLRTDERYKKTKSSLLPKRFSREDTKDRFVKDTSFYMGIFRKRKHICEYCGDPILSEPRTYNFDHVLEKSSFPTLRHEALNIRITCLDCHTLKTQKRYTPMMEIVIEATIKALILTGKVREIGRKDIYRIKDWIVAK